MALFHNLLACGGGVCVCGWGVGVFVCVCVWWKTTIPKISGTAGSMNMKFLPDVKYHVEAQNPKKNI